ncbi:MAG: hypothetical protein ACRCZF_15450 [Gemmataceae bacterium]
MLTCDIAQNRLLVIVPEGRDLPAEVATHLSLCDRCAAYQTRLLELEAQMRNLPVPVEASEAAKLAFLEHLTEQGPVIKTLPMLPPARRIRWADLRPWVSSLAAAVVLGIGTYALFPTKRPKPIEPEFARHDLLRQVVKLDTELAKLRTPTDRIPKLSDLADALQTESAGIYQAARRNDEMRSLAKLYETVITQGMIAQAKQIQFAAPGERKAVLTTAAERLAASANRTNALSATAPREAQESLARMIQAAETGRRELLKLAEGGV